MRRNRQKLHKALRLKAEANERRRRQRKERARQAQARARAVADQALRGKPPVSLSGVPQTALEGVRSLCQLARIPPATIARVERVMAAASRLDAGLATQQGLPWFLMLARPAWVRPPETLGRVSGSIRRKRDALATHLFAAYPVPPFLLRALDLDPLAVARVPEEDAWAVDVLALVGRGGSLRKAVGGSVLPTPLTRQMVHSFLDARANTSPIEALRKAQVRALGGSKAVTKRLLQTRLGVLRGPDPKIGEAFWQRVLTWLCARPDVRALSANRLEELLAWCESAQRAALERGDELRLSGRSIERVLALADAQALRERRARGNAFPASGLLGFERGDWAIREICTPAELVDEGTAMQHCASSYRGLLRKRKVALFSLTQGGARRVTIEVSLGSGRVVQAKRFANAKPFGHEREIIRAWAEHNRLRVAC